MRTLLNKSGLKRLCFFLAPMMLVATQNCTDLTEVPHDALTPATAFKTDAKSSPASPACTRDSEPWNGSDTSRSKT